jgi:hypothetical protein
VTVGFPESVALQWSPGRETGDTPSAVPPRLLERLASMEPRSRDRGYRGPRKLLDNIVIRTRIRGITWSDSSLGFSNASPTENTFGFNSIGPCER